MNQMVTNKMTFYDIVTLIMPSAWVCYSYDWLKETGKEDWIGYIALFGVLLMLGLFLKAICAWWNGLWFRNNTGIIKQERMRAYGIGGEYGACRWLDILFFDPAKYIVCSLFAFSFPREQKDLLDYYDQYEIAEKDIYYGKRIEILESHVAFLQTWIWALIISLPAYFPCCCGCSCCKNHLDLNIGIIVLACYGCITTMGSIQRKIYKMVWEAKNKEK